LVRTEARAAGEERRQGPRKPENEGAVMILQNSRNYLPGDSIHRE